MKTWIILLCSLFGAVGASLGYYASHTLLAGLLACALWTAVGWYGNERWTQ